MGVILAIAAAALKRMARTVICRIHHIAHVIDQPSQDLLNGIKQGCIYVTNGWWIGTGGSVNFCSLGRETDMGYGAAFHDALVEIEPA